MLIYLRTTLIFVGLLFAIFSGPGNTANGVAQGDTVPFMLVVEHAEGSRCAGSLVSLHSAMTSASCARLGSGSIFVLAGPYLTGRVSRAEGARRVSSIALPRDHIRSDDYSGAVDDVAILRLSSPFVSSALVRPILMETEHTSYEAPGTMCNLVRALPAVQLRRRRRDENFPEPFKSSAEPMTFSRDIDFTSSDDWIFPFAFSTEEYIFNSAPNVASDRISTLHVTAIGSFIQPAEYNITEAQLVTAAFDKTRTSFLDNASTSVAASGSTIKLVQDNFTHENKVPAFDNTATSSLDMTSISNMAADGSTTQTSQDNFSQENLVTFTINNTVPLFLGDVSDLPNVIDFITGKRSVREDLLNTVSTNYPDIINDNVTLYDDKYTEYFISTSATEIPADIRTIQQNSSFLETSFTWTIQSSLLELVNSTSGTMQSEDTTQFETTDTTPDQNSDETFDIKKRSLDSTRAIRPIAIFRIFDVRVISADQCYADNALAGNHYWVSMRDQVLCTRGETFCQTDWGTGLVCGGKLCGVLTRSTFPSDGGSGARQGVGCGASHTLQSLAKWRRFLHCAHSVGACSQDPCVKVCREVMLTGDMDAAPPKQRPAQARTGVSAHASPAIEKSPQIPSVFSLPVTKPAPPPLSGNDDEDEDPRGMEIDMPEGYTGKGKTNDDSFGTDNEAKLIESISEQKHKINSIEIEQLRKPYMAVSNQIKPQTPFAPTRTLPKGKLPNQAVNADFDPHRPDFKSGEYGDNAADYRNPDEDYQTKGGGARRPPTRSPTTPNTRKPIYNRVEPPAMQQVIAESDAESVAKSVAKPVAKPVSKPGAKPVVKPDAKTFINIDDSTMSPSEFKPRHKVKLMRNEAIQVRTTISVVGISFVLAIRFIV